MRFGRSTAEWAKGIKIDQPGVIAPWVVRVTNSFLDPLVRLLFRARLRGLEHLPCVFACAMAGMGADCATLARTQTLGSFADRLARYCGNFYLCSADD